MDREKGANDAVIAGFLVTTPREDQMESDDERIRWLV